MSTGTKYDVEAVTTETLFGTGSTAYEIPVFQRAYAWGNAEVDDLLDDLFADHDLTADQTYDEPYFLGSIVLAAGDEASSPLAVLDGQQRLTTISLILAVLAAQLKALEDEGHADIRKHLAAGKAGAKKAPILTLQPSDHDTYARILENGMIELDKQAARTRLGRAVARIRADLEDRLASARGKGATVEKALWRLVHRVLYGVAFVRIVAPSQSAAFELFETLNDRGLALSAADLVKNKLLAKASKASFEDVVDAWDNIVQTVGEAEIVNFLRFFWIADTEFVRKAKLFERYDKKLKSATPDEITGLVTRLKHLSVAYRHIVSPDEDAETWPEGWPTTLAATLERINDFKARSCRPLFLAVAGDPSALLKAAQFAETLTLRHSVIGEGNANSLERGYDKACRMLREGHDLDTALKEALLPELPRDADFVASLRRVRMARADAAWRRILLVLNQRVSSGETAVLGPKHVHIEHILPQRPSPTLLKSLGLDPQEAADLVGMLGNLTLLHAKKNHSASNKAFAEKKPLFASSEISLNKALLAKDAWGRTEIEERTEALSRLALEAWPTPSFGDLPTPS